MYAIRRIYYKGTSCHKNNNYNWCGVIDKNGRMLKTEVPVITQEFMNYIYDASQSASDMLIDDYSYSCGIHKKIKRFFKFVSPQTWKNEFLKYNKERGRWLRYNLYVFQNFYDAFHNNEIFTKGSILWMLCSLETLQNWMPYIDSCRIVRCNHDFVELYGEDAVLPESFDNIIKTNYILRSTVQFPRSQKLMKVFHAKNSIRKENKTVEIANNGMKIIRTDMEKQELRKEGLPDLFDYHVEIYARNFMNDIEERINVTRTKRNSSNKKDPDRINRLTR